MECFKCPKRRSPGEAGWYFVHFEDDHRIPGPCRIHVCPRHYLAFAATERERWTPIVDIPNHDARRTNGSTPLEPAVHLNGSDGSQKAVPHQNGSAAPTEALRHQNGSAVPGERPGCTADELIAVLTRRGLAGWAFLVRDVAAGRVRRLHLRQLPAEQEVREALVTYLHSAGTALTISRIFVTHQQRSQAK